MKLDLLSNFQTPSELAATSRQIIDLVKNTRVREPLLPTLTDKVEKNLSRFEEALQNIHGSSYTEDVSKKDVERDSAFIALKTLFLAAKKRVDKKYAQAGLHLSNIIYNIDADLHRKDYAVESEKLKELFEELDKAGNKEYLERLHAVEWLDELKMAQAEFEKVFKLNPQDGAAKKVVQIKDVRPQLEQSIEILLEYISLQADLRASDDVINLANSVEGLITEANNAIGQ